jgi:hypothetical protein
MMTSKAEVLAPQTARDIVEAAHSSWNAGSIDGMLQMYVDDLEYITNTGPDGSSLTIHGKEDFRARFEPVMAIMCPRTSSKASTSRMESLESGYQPTPGIAARD